MTAFRSFAIGQRVLPALLRQADDGRWYSDALVAVAYRPYGAIYARAICLTDKQVGDPLSIVPALPLTPTLLEDEGRFRDLKPLIIDWAERPELGRAGLKPTASRRYWSPDHASAPVLEASLRLFRVGPLSSPPASSGELAGFHAALDAVMPVGRVPREGALFCSPSLFGLSRWLRAHFSLRPFAASGESLDLHEIGIVDPRGIYAYSIPAWDRAGVSYLAPEERAERGRQYWASGIPISDWQREAISRRLDAQEWEVLLSPAQVAFVRPLAPERVLAAVPADDWRRAELVRQVARQRRWQR